LGSPIGRLTASSASRFPAFVSSSPRTLTGTIARSSRTSLPRDVCQRCIAPDTTVSMMSLLVARSGPRTASISLSAISKVESRRDRLRW
jgi:hypothetical protein